jgi:aminoglycoside phosphotransferase (APT) family kinase protein
VGDLVSAWGVDCVLNEAVVGAVVREQFRELAPWQVRFLQEGWDSRVYLVNDVWIFRMPKRANVVPSLKVERRLLPRLDEALPVDVPRFEWHGVPSERFPHPFSGYRLLPGDLGDSMPSRAFATPAVARQLGELLRSIHEFPVERALEAGVPQGHEAWTPACWPWLREAVASRGDEIEHALGGRRWRAFQPLVDMELPAASEQDCFRHADLGVGHLLLDRDTRAVTGVIDWADSNLGDPAVDFAGLEIFVGAEFVDRMLDAYAPTDVMRFRARIRQLSKRTAAIWAVETLLRDPENLPGALRNFDDVFEARDV